MQDNPITRPTKDGFSSLCSSGQLPHAEVVSPPTPLDLPALAAHLQQQCIGWPAYGLPFCNALDQAVRHIERGAVLTRISPTAYHVRALPHAMPYRVTLGRCQCDAPGPWCWHRGLAHLIAALPEGDQHGT